jgi:hypothetical protein
VHELLKAAHERKKRGRGEEEEIEGREEGRAEGREV